MRRKYIQMVHLEDPEERFALFEAVLDTDTGLPIWIADTPIKDMVFESYKECIWIWSKNEKKYSGVLDILEQEEYNTLLEEEQEKELNFE